MHSGAGSCFNKRPFSTRRAGCRAIGTAITVARYETTVTAEKRRYEPC